MRRRGTERALLPRPGRGGGFLAVAALVLLASCGGGGETPAGQPDKPLTAVGISVGSLRNPYHAAIARGAEAAARRISPTVQVTTAGDEYSAFKQADQIDAFVAAHTDLIVLVPADSEQIGDAIARARQAGVTVVAVDAPALGADAEVAGDNIAAGAIACAALAQGMGGHGQVAILGGPPSPFAVARALGCADALARVPDIRVAAPDADGHGTQEGGRRVMRDLFAGTGQIDGVFAITDAEALAAADAAAQVGRNLLVVAPEGSPAMEAALANRARAGVIATAALDPYRMGGNAVRVGREVRNGRAPAAEERLLDPALVTRDTVHDYKGWLAERQ